MTEERYVHYAAKRCPVLDKDLGRALLQRHFPSLSNPVDSFHLLVVFLGPIYQRLFSQLS